MRKTVLIAVIVACFVSVVSILAQQGPDYSKVEVKAQKVSGSVYMLTGRGGNIGAWVGEDGIVLIDDQYAPLAGKIEAALKGVSDKPIKYVINTHYHGDHVGANGYFGAKAPIVAQENVRKRLASGTKTHFGEVKPLSPAELPVITYEDKLWLHLNGEDILLTHIPAGHTDGDTVVYFSKSKVVHLGDDFFNGGTFPFIDVDNGGSVPGLIAGLEKLLPELPDDVKVIPGHGPLATKAELSAYVASLKEMLALVQAGKQQGKTADQLKQEKVLAKWEPSLNNGFIKADSFIDTLYAVNK